MGNLGNPRSIASCHFTKYGPSCKSCWYIKVFSENKDHPESIKIVIIKKCPKLLRIYVKYQRSERLWSRKSAGINGFRSTCQLYKIIIKKKPKLHKTVTMWCGDWESVGGTYHTCDVGTIVHLASIMEVELIKDRALILIFPVGKYTQKTYTVYGFNLEC